MLLEDESVIPRSTKTSFELTVKNDVRESDEIKSIFKEIEDLKLKFSKDLKINIIAAATIERDTIFSKAITSLIKCCIGMAKFYLAYHIDDDTITDSPPSLEHILDDILPQIDKIKDDFNITSTCDSRTICHKLLKTNSENENETDLNHLVKSKLKPVKDTLNKHYQNIVASLLVIYLKTTINRQKLLKATKSLEQFETDLLAEDVVEKMETETSVTPTELLSLIKSEIKTELSKNNRGSHIAPRHQRKQ